MTLSEFSANSTNDKWEPAFVQGNDNFTYKLAKLGSLAMYWNTDTGSLAGQDTEEFIKSFDELISRGKTLRDHQYILKPVSGTGKITLNKLKTHDKPKTDVTLLFDEIAFAVDQDQYRDALKMVDTFHFFLRHQQYFKYRPKQTVKEDPKAWLKFAFTTVHKGIHDRNVVWTWANMKKRRDERKQYVELYKKKQTEKINLDESAALKQLELDLPYEDIRFYRSLAKSEMRKENALKPKQVAKQAQGWISWAWSGSTATSDQATEEGSTVLTEQQRKELYDAIEWDEKQALAEGVDAPRDSILLNISARLRTGSFTLKKSKFHDSEDIVQLLFDTFGAHFKQRPDSFIADLALEDMRILDSTMPGSLYKEMVRLKDNAEGSDRRRSMKLRDHSQEQSELEEIEDPLFFASFESNPLSGIAQSELIAKLKAMEIIYNAHCIETLQKFVKPPKSQMESITALMEVAGEAAKDFREQGRASLEFALSEHKTLAAHLDLQAPLIIVPESCTDPSAACIILDAGKIHIESNLVGEDKIKELQAKQNQKLTEDEMRELHALCYDRFKLRLEATQILIGPSVKQTLKALRSASDRRFHVVDRINMDFLLEISILPKNASLTLTKFRISGHLPSLSARVSDAKYKTMMRIIDVAIPNDDVPESSPRVVTPTRADTGSHTHSRAFSSAYNKVPDLVVFPDKDSDDAVDDDDDNDKFVTAPMDIDEKDLLYRQKIFEFRFTVGELRGSLYKASPQADDDGQLLVDIVLQQFALDFVLRQYDMQADVVLKSLIVEDRMNVDSPPEFQKIITSEQIGEDDQELRDLVRVKYTQVKPESPEFQSVYGGVDKNVEIALSTINVIVTQKSILTLFDFTLTTFTSPDVAVVSPVQDHNSKEVALETGQKPDESKIRVKIELTSIVLVLNQDGIRLATLKISKGDVGVFINGPTLRAAAKIGNLSVRDDVNVGADGASNYRQIISIEGEELVDFVYETFDPNSATTYPGYDSSVYLRINSVKVNFLEEPLRKILNFLTKFARMKALFDNARTAAMSQVQQAQQSAGKMHFDLLVRTPIVIFPRISGLTAERDVVIANLGELFAINSFKPFDDRERSPSVNKISAGIRKIGLSSNFHYEDENSEQLQMVEDADAIFDVEMVERESGSERPEIQVIGHISDIKLRVTQSQYKFLMDLSQSVPAVFIADELDEEERELGESLSVQKTTAITTPTEAEIVSDLRPELGIATKNGKEFEVYTSLDADLVVGTLAMEIYSNKEDSPVRDLEKASLSRFSLNSTAAKFSSRSDGSSQGELNVKSFTVEDTRYSKTNKFREVIPAINHEEGHQFNASVTISGGLEKALVAMLTIDTPKVIFSLEHIFALQSWVFSAFTDAANNTPTSEQLDQMVTSTSEPQELANNEDSGLTLPTRKSARKSSRRKSSAGNIKPQVQPATNTASPAMSIAYRVNVVDPSIILVADASNSQSEAIVLSAKQVLLTQQSVMMLNVDKAGMYLTKMGKNLGHLRLLDDFSVTLSLESRSNAAKQNIQIIEIDIDPLVLRVSLRDILLAMHIANKAAQLSADTSAKDEQAIASSRRKSDTTMPGSRRKSVGTGRVARSTVARQSLATKIKEPASDSGSSSPIKSSIVNREELRATLQGLRLVLIGDLHELPMLDMSIGKFMVNIKDWSSEVSLPLNVAHNRCTWIPIYVRSRTSTTLPTLIGNL